MTRLDLHPRITHPHNFTSTMQPRPSHSSPTQLHLHHAATTISQLIHIAHTSTMQLHLSHTPPSLLTKPPHDHHIHHQQPHSFSNPLNPLFSLPPPLFILHGTQLPCNPHSSHRPLPPSRPSHTQPFSSPMGSHLPHVAARHHMQPTYTNLLPITHMQLKVSIQPPSSAHAVATFHSFVFLLF